MRLIVATRSYVWVLLLALGLACGSGGGGTQSAAPSGSPPAELSYSEAPAIFATGAAITPDSPRYSGGTPSGFQVAPDLPAGLQLDPKTGVISGTPTRSQAASSYVITAENAYGRASCTLSISIQDLLQGPLTYSSNPAVYAVGDTIPSNLPTYAQGTSLAFQVSPPLPSGLTIDNVTGAITGKPTTPSPSQTYTVTASNDLGSVTCNLLLTVKDQPPSNISYPAVQMTKGVPITPLVPTGNTGGTVIGYTVTPSLPDGLVLDTQTGVISGTPSTAISAVSVVVTAFNSGGNWPIGLGFSIEDVTGPWSYYSESPSYTLGQPIPPNTAYLTGWTADGFAVSPSLPSGLALDASTGTISGTPLQLTPAATYTVVATDHGQTTSHSLQITVVDVPPDNFSYSPASLKLVIGSPMTQLSPSVAGGQVTSFTVWPPLPSGLNFNPQTGVISGTPSQVSASTTYYLEASNSGGNAFTNLILEVDDLPPTSLSYPFASFVFMSGVDSGRYGPGNGGGVITSYSVTPSLPDGITLDATTGILSAFPTASSPATSYTITGSNSGGSTTCTVVITVN